VGAERYTSAVAARLAAGPAQVGVRASGQPGRRQREVGHGDAAAPGQL